MTCTQCGARLTPDELEWQTGLCDGCALAPTDRAAARAALQRALDTYLASHAYAVLVQTGGRRYLWEPVAAREDVA